MLCCFFLSFSSCWWMFGCVLGLCVSLCVCVFSPAASVDYGSFADRCSTWLELLRLKAHTIRRGSVKTSRRTHSLAHPDDHTYRFTSSSCTRARIHPHTPPCMPLGAEPYQSSNQALAFFFFFNRVWKLKPHTWESPEARNPWQQSNLFIKKKSVLFLTPLCKLTQWQRNIAALACGAKGFLQSGLTF